MFTEFSMLSDEAEIYGAARFYFIKVFSQFKREEIWEYQAKKKTKYKAHFTEICWANFKHCVALKDNTP